MRKNKLLLWVSIIVAALFFVGAWYLFDHHEHTFDEEIPLGKNERGYAFLKHCTECGQGEIVYYDALVTFVDDDGKTQAMLHWEKIIDATGIKMTAALIPGKISEETDYDSWWSYAGWDLLERLREKGVDFVNHTFSHTNLTKLTEEEIHQDLQKAKSALKEHDIDSNILVYPNNAHDQLVESIVDDYFDAAFACGGKVITETFSKCYGLDRININDATLTKTIAFDAERIVECQGIKSLEKLKEELNVALENRGWLVFMTHAYDSPGGQYYFDEESEQSIIDCCLYIHTLENVKIVTLTEGVEASGELS